MPSPPARRFDLQVEEQIDREAEIWHLRYSYYLREGTRVKHGVEVERKRLRDRERHATEFQETRRLYEDGEAQDAQVVSIYREGVLREREYIAAPRVSISVSYNESGQEILQTGRTARGAQRKRERITQHFDTLFELN